MFKARSTPICVGGFLPCNARNIPADVSPDPAPCREPGKGTARRKRTPTILFLMAYTAIASLAPPSYAGPTPAPKDAAVYIIWPQNGAVIHGGKFWLRMGLRNMGVAPKGVKMDNVGHHHLLVDTELPPEDQQIPSDRNHLHFGAGETEARIELPPGKHTLQLLLGDHDHVPHNPPIYSKKITVTVP